MFICRQFWSKALGLFADNSIQIHFCCDEKKGHCLLKNDIMQIMQTQIKREVHMIILYSALSLM